MEPPTQATGQFGLMARNFPIPFVLPNPNQMNASVASGDRDAITTVISPYRDPFPTHTALDLECRRCGEHPLYYAYFPYVLPIPGPLCRACLIEWRGISGVKYATMGIGGFFSFPMPINTLPNEWQKYVVPSCGIRTIRVPGERPNISPWID